MGQLGDINNTVEVYTAEEVSEELQSGNAYAATASGTDTYILGITPALTAYADNQRFFVKFANANTGPVTININSLGAKAIKKNGGVALVAGDITAGSVFAISYDGTDFELVGKINTSGSSLFSEYHYVERITTASTTGANIIYTTLTTSALSGGTYILEVAWTCRNSESNGDWEIDVTEGTNAAGSNTSLLVEGIVEEGIDNGGNQRYARSLTRDIVLTAGVKNINIEMGQTGNGTFSNYFGCIRLYKKL